MSPELATLQANEGAWGVTVASLQQARTAWELGFRRIHIANEVLDDAALRWIAFHRQQGHVEIMHWVDSIEGVQAAARAGALDVFIELGYKGGRTGLRNPDDVASLARLALTHGLSIRGVAAYEGGLASTSEVETFVRVAFARHTALLAQGLLSDNAMFTVGGSAYFDVIADVLKDRPDDVRILLRSGAYLTHDDGLYRRRTPFNRVKGTLRPAIEVWTRVTSTPETGKAIVAFGKRDVPYDLGMPVPLALIREGEELAVSRSDLVVNKLDDQHAYLSLSDGFELIAGDVLKFGVSHPCTAFDKWRMLPVLDDEGNVVGHIRTYF